MLSVRLRARALFATQNDYYQIYSIPGPTVWFRRQRARPLTRPLAFELRQLFLVFFFSFFFFFHRFIPRAKLHDVIKLLQFLLTHSGAVEQRHAGIVPWTLVVWVRYWKRTTIVRRNSFRIWQMGIAWGPNCSYFVVDKSFKIYPKVSLDGKDKWQSVQPVPEGGFMEASTAEWVCASVKSWLLSTRSPA